ncbi:MAG: hypothetical protein QM786_10185 [Breznakibacter sp.]
MVLFRDPSELKVISVGLLLGMVSCLHGLPIAELSLTVQDNKIILVYTGESAVLDANALPLFDAQELLEEPLCVIKHTGILRLDQGASSIWESSNPFLGRVSQEVLALGVDKVSDLLTERPDIAFFAACICHGLDGSSSEGIPISVFCPLSFPLLQSVTPAHAIRAGPLS